MLAFKSTSAKSLGMLMICCALFSFKGIFGGESFEVYINKKMVLQQFLYKNETVKSIPVSQAEQDVEVYYHHCGKTGTGRVISLRNNGKTIKEWRYQDTPGSKSSMGFNLKDPAAQNAINHGDLQLYYFSNELPNGRLLAVFATNANTAAAKK